MRSEFEREQKIDEAKASVPPPVPSERESGAAWASTLGNSAVQRIAQSAAGQRVPISQDALPLATAPLARAPDDYVAGADGSGFAEQHGPAPGAGPGGLDPSMFGELTPAAPGAAPGPGGLDPSMFGELTPSAPAPGAAPGDLDPSAVGELTPSAPAPGAAPGGLDPSAVGEIMSPGPDSGPGAGPGGLDPSAVGEIAPLAPGPGPDPSSAGELVAPSGAGSGGGGWEEEAGTA